MSLESVLKDLVETLEDGRKGFTQAAEKLRDDGNTALASQFTELAGQRTKLASELRGLGSQHGVTIEEDGSTGAALHRGWMSLKDALTGSDPDSILKAAQTGEEHAVKEYEKALDDDGLPVAEKAIVQRQLTEIMSAKTRVDAMTTNS